MEYELTTGSSYISLDGVPFNLDEKALPIKRIKNLAILKDVNYEEISFLEYDDSTEKYAIDKLCDNPISFLKNFYESHFLLKETLKDEMNNISSAQTSNTQERNFPIEFTNNIRINGTSEPIYLNTSYYNFVNSYSMPKEATKQASALHTKSSNILFPTPVSYSSRVDKSLNNVNKIDLRDFESEMDPFENISLKVINDIEELDKVFLPTKSTLSNHALELHNYEPSYTNLEQQNKASASSVNTTSSFNYYSNNASEYDTTQNKLAYVPQNVISNSNQLFNQPTMPSYGQVFNSGINLTNFRYNPNDITNLKNDNMYLTSIYPLAECYNAYTSNYISSNNFKQPNYYANKQTDSITIQSNVAGINGHSLANNFYAQQAKSSYPNIDFPSLIYKDPHVQTNGKNSIQNMPSAVNKLVRTKSVPNLDMVEFASSTTCSKPSYLW